MRGVCPPVRREALPAAATLLSRPAGNDPLHADGGVTVRSESFPRYEPATIRRQSLGGSVWCVLSERSVLRSVKQIAVSQRLVSRGCFGDVEAVANATESRLATNPRQRAIASRLRPAGRRADCAGPLCRPSPIQEGARSATSGNSAHCVSWGLSRTRATLGVE